MNIAKSVIEGGYTMIPYLVILFFLVTALILEIIKRPFCRRVALFYFIFPLTFLILAVFRVILALHTHFTYFVRTGQVDPAQYSEQGLIFTRSALILIWTAIASFFIALLLAGLRYRAGTKKGEQGVATERDRAGESEIGPMRESDGTGEVQRGGLVS